MPASYATVGGVKSAVPRVGARALAATLLVAVVAIAARRHPFAYGRGADNLVHGETIASILTFVLLFGGIAVVIASLVLRRAGPVAAAPRRPWWIHIAWFLALIALLWLAPKSARDVLQRQPTVDRTAARRARPVEVGSRNRDRSTGSGRSTLLIVILGAGSVALIVSGRRPKTDGRAPLDEPDDLGVVRSDVQAGLDVAAYEPDVRAAIVAAFAAIQEALRARGIARSPDETAAEFVGRVLHEAAVPAAPIRGLTGLFEEARYSTHRLGEADRTRAMGHLDEIRSALAQ